MSPTQNAAHPSVDRDLRRSNSYESNEAKAQVQHPPRLPRVIGSTAISVPPRPSRNVNPDSSDSQGRDPTPTNMTTDPPLIASPYSAVNKDGEFSVAVPAQAYSIYRPAQKYVAGQPSEWS
jgi:hypothetical protein